MQPCFILHVMHTLPRDVTACECRHCGQAPDDRVHESASLHACLTACIHTYPALHQNCPWVCSIAASSDPPAALILPGLPQLTDAFFSAHSSFPHERQQITGNLERQHLARDFEPQQRWRKCLPWCARVSAACQMTQNTQLYTHAAMHTIHQPPPQQRMPCLTDHRAAWHLRTLLLDVTPTMTPSSAVAVTT